MVCFGDNANVHLYGRSGEKLHMFSINSPYLVDWDSQSKIVAISNRNSNFIYIFFLNVRELRSVESTFEPTFLQFSKNGNYLATGSVQGKFWIHDYSSGQSQTYQGTYDQPIIDGAWNSKKTIGSLFRRSNN
jgi:hypothetical protein